MADSLTSIEQIILSIGKQVALELGILAKDETILKFAKFFERIDHFDDDDFDKDLMADMLRILFKHYAHLPDPKPSKEEQVINRLIVEDARQILRNDLLGEHSERFAKRLAAGGKTLNEFKAWLDNFSADSPMTVLFAKRLVASEARSQHFSNLDENIKKLHHQHDLLVEEAKTCRGTPRHKQIMQERHEISEKSQKLLNEMKMLLDSRSDKYNHIKDFKLQ